MAKKNETTIGRHFLIRRFKAVKSGFSLKNRMIFEIQIVTVELIIFNSNAKQEKV